jgi:hypothetical protein
MGGAMNKYKNRKTRTSDGILHDSTLEAQRWCELKLLERAGKIKDLKRQVEYELIPAQYESYDRWGKNGRRLQDGLRLVERSVCYVADFVYVDTETGEVIVEDAKGVKTKDYIIKRKLMLQVHKIRIKEMKMGC